jgi:hypothetical protein
MTRAALIAGLVLLGACRQDMHDQPKYKALRASPFFADGRASRPVVEGTIARGHLDLAGARTTGKVGATYAANPLPHAEATFRRGRERYDVYCAPCHDRVGTGDGMIVERGFKAPPTFHQDRLRTVADGYLFETMTQGFGVMPSYAAPLSLPRGTTLEVMSGMKEVLGAARFTLPTSSSSAWIGLSVNAGSSEERS